MERFYGQHGDPEWIVKGCGAEWLDGFWTKFCEVFGTLCELSTAVHPEPDGGAEHANQEIQAFFRAFINFEQTD